MLLQLKDQAEIVFVINAADIEKNKVRNDLGITYDADILRLTDAFRSIGLLWAVSSLRAIRGKSAADAFKSGCKALGSRCIAIIPSRGIHPMCKNRQRRWLWQERLYRN